MTLGELLPALHKASSDRVVRGLIELLEEWRTSASTADELRQSVEKYIGNSWIALDAEGNLVHTTVIRSAGQTREHKLLDVAAVRSLWSCKFAPPENQGDLFRMAYDWQIQEVGAASAAK